MVQNDFKLDFVIIGGQKCGSTYLQTVIEKHPEVDMPSGEVPYLESPDYEDNGIDKLRIVLNDLDQSKLIGIKRPNYLSKPEVKKRMIAINPDVKAIVILRNPIERLKSAYFHYINDGFTPVLPLNKGVDLLLKGKLKAKYPRTDELIEFGLYAKYLKDYITLFKDNLLVLFYDDLKTNQLETIKKCYSFLNIDNSFVLEDSHLNSRPQKVNYSLLRARLLTKKNAHKYVYNDKRTRLFLKKQSVYNKFVCKTIDRIDQRIISRFFYDDKKPSFDQELKKSLIEIYKADISNLEAMCNVDLSNWTKI